MREIELPFYAAVALAALAFMVLDLADRRYPVLRRALPLPITAGLLTAFALLAPRLAGLSIRVPHQGDAVDFLMGLLTANMGLHLTPKVLRKGLPAFVLLFLVGIALFWIQLVVVWPLAAAGAHPLATAVITGPLAYVGAPYNLNPPAQVQPVAELLRPAYSDPETAAQGMMMLGVLAGPLLAAWCGHRFFLHAGQKPPEPPAQHEKTPSVPISAFAQQETHILGLMLLLVALAFGIQSLLRTAIPGLTSDELPVIVVAYLLGGLTRLLIERTAGSDRMPESALTAVLLGPTMSFVLTYAIMSVPLHSVASITPMMALAGLLAIATSALCGLLMFPVFSWLMGRYYGAVIATALIAVTTGWGPVAMSFLRRSTDEQGEIEPMPAILPLNAFYLFPWSVILSTRLAFALFGTG